MPSGDHAQRNKVGAAAKARQACPTAVATIHIDRWCSEFAFYVVPFSYHVAIAHLCGLCCFTLCCLTVFADWRIDLVFCVILPSLPCSLKFLAV